MTKDEWTQIVKECGLNPIKWFMFLVFFFAAKSNAESLKKEKKE